MREVIYSESAFKAVLELAATRWAILAVRKGGSAATVNNPNRRFGREQKRRDDAQRAELAKALFAMTGTALPKPKVEAYVVPRDWQGKRQKVYNVTLAAQEVTRLKRAVLELAKKAPAPQIDGAPGCPEPEGEG